MSCARHLPTIIRREDICAVSLIPAVCQNGKSPECRAQNKKSARVFRNLYIAPEIVNEKRLVIEKNNKHRSDYERLFTEILPAVRDAPSINQRRPPEGQRR